ncbi:LytR/AlgR family response regulator transcription factor [Roseimarinus sediminis]|uniref:LytR/AlgR family response regulator transcription factor n=1 Tax=Roseimarinus sediminis TaxID=1610899 RepID=UPI003D1DD216
MKTHCMIIDDEPLARELIAGYLEKIDNLELIASCSNAMQAFQVLKEKKIDLIFLDINMPQITGIDFIRSLSNPPKVIIVSAHKEYALEGFELDVVDYLLKPVSFSRLLKAIDKFFMLSNNATRLHGDSRNTEEAFVYLKENKKVVKVVLNEIDYIEAMGEYCQVFVEGRRIIPKMSIKQFEELLADKDFIRIHKSIVVPLKKVTAFSASIIEINKEKELPIGRSYKKSVLHALEYNGKVQDT